MEWFMPPSELPPERYNSSDEETEADENDGDEFFIKDSTRADILLVDQHGKILGRPWLTMITDPYSRRIVGFNLESCSDGE
jgi:hypothetical protein